MSIHERHVPQPSHSNPLSSPPREGMNGSDDPEELEAVAELEDYYASLEEEDADDEDPEHPDRSEYEEG